MPEHLEWTLASPVKGVQFRPHSHHQMPGTRLGRIITGPKRQARSRKNHLDDHGSPHARPFLVSLWSPRSACSCDGSRICSFRQTIEFALRSFVGTPYEIAIAGGCSFSSLESSCGHLKAQVDTIYSPKSRKNKSPINHRSLTQ